MCMYVCTPQAGAAQTRWTCITTHPPEPHNFERLGTELIEKHELRVLSGVVVLLHAQRRVWLVGAQRGTEHLHRARLQDPANVQMDSWVRRIRQSTYFELHLTIFVVQYCKRKRRMSAGEGSECQKSHGQRHPRTDSDIWCIGLPGAKWSAVVGQNNSKGPGHDARIEGLVAFSRLHFTLWIHRFLRSAATCYTLYDSSDAPVQKQHTLTRRQPACTEWLAEQTAICCQLTALLG